MRIGRKAFALFLLLASLLAIAQITPVIAQEPEESIDLAPTFPSLEAISGSNFQFEVELRFTGSEARVFELDAIAPQGWSVHMTPQFESERRISAIRLEPGLAGRTKIKVVAISPFFPLTDPGEYPITLEATSGGISGTTELTAVITARYDMALASTNELLNTTARAGSDNFFSIEVQNRGTAPIDNIQFSSIKPSGWTIDFNPEKIDSLPALDFQTVDVNIKPPTETIAGDYRITLRAKGEQAPQEEIEIRVTVETPTIWGWVGVGIIVIVIAGLTFLFIRFSRR
jgi:uncharacterized repeat protein (TIGR01451 family)